MTKDYYKILGVDKNATKQEIKKAYKKLAMKWHPDRFQDEKEKKKAEEKFKEINEAASILADDKKRAQYDQFGTADFSGGGFGGFDFSDFTRGFDFSTFDFDNIFDRFFSGGRKRRPRRGPDLQYNLEITLKEAAFGTEKEIPLNKLDVCKICHGQGGELETCSGCGGYGMVRRTTRTPFGLFQTQTTCRKCGGSGNAIKKPCPKCDGEGRIRIKKKLKVDIPAGVNKGTKLRIKGEGIAGENSASPGDLYLVIYVKEDPIFKREENDLYLNIPISFTQAVLGDEIEVPTLKGKAKLKIPPGTQSNTIFKMKNKGIPYLNGFGQGHQMVRVQVKTPTKLNKKQKELIKKLAALEKEKPSKSFLRNVFG